jgi:hypothetical protein
VHRGRVAAAAAAAAGAAPLRSLPRRVRSVREEKKRTRPGAPRLTPSAPEQARRSTHTSTYVHFARVSHCMRALQSGNFCRHE